MTVSTAAAVLSNTTSTISDLEARTTAAISLANAVAQDLREIAPLVPPYDTVNKVTYNSTAFDTSSITTPKFTEIESAKTELNSISGNVDSLSDASGSINPSLKVRLDAVNVAFETLYADALAESQRQQDSPLPFSEDDYVADIIASVETRLTENLNGTNSGSSRQETTYYDRHSVRAITARSTELSNTLSEFSGRGFPQSSDSLADMQSHILARQAMSETDRGRMVTIQTETLSLENRKRAIAAGLRYDQILLTFFERRQQRAFQVAAAAFKAVKDMADLLFSITGEQYAMQPEYIAMTAENQKLYMSSLSQKLKAIETVVDALITKGEGFISAYITESDTYADRKKSLNTEKIFNLSEREIDFEVAKTNLDNSIRVFANNLSAFGDMTDVKIGAFSSASKLLKTIASAATNNMTTVLGMISDAKSTKQE